MNNQNPDYPVLGGTVFPVLTGVDTGLPSLDVPVIAPTHTGQFPPKFFMVNGEPVRKVFSQKLASEDPAMMVGQFSELFGRTLKTVEEAAYHIQAYHEAGGAIVTVNAEELDRELKQLRIRFGDVTLEEGRALANRFQELSDEREDAKACWRAAIAARDQRAAEVSKAAEAGRDWIRDMKQYIKAYEIQLDAWESAEKAAAEKAVADARLRKDVAEMAWRQRRFNKTVD